MENITVKEGKAPAIISYISLFGTIIAFIMNGNKKNSFASFHLRQMIGLNLFYLANQWLIYPYLGNTAGWIVGVFLFFLWIIGFIGVVQGEEKLVPFIGQQFQTWFQNI